MTPEIEEQEPELQKLTPEQRAASLDELERKMREAAKNFEFEKAAQLRDRLKALREPKPFGVGPGAGGAASA